MGCRRWSYAWAGDVAGGVGKWSFFDTEGARRGRGSAWSLAGPKVSSGVVFDAKATSRAVLANVVEGVRRRRLALATAHPRRASLRFLEEARWSRPGLIAYDGHRDVIRAMFEGAVRSGRVDRAALSTLGWANVDGRRHPFDDYWVGADYWQLLVTLADPCVFNPPAYWSLLWALLQGEQSFQTKWVDAWSHEERLTGHFLSTAAFAGHELAPAFESLDRAWGGGARCSVDYVDTATGRRERQSGADFGVVVHGSDDVNGEWVKAALFQVKKTERFGSFEIDFDQLRALLRTPNLGFYLIFTRNAPSGPPPVVVPAGFFENDLDRRAEQRQKEPGGGRASEPLGSEVVSARAPTDWAFFLALAVADPGSGIGVSAATPFEAARLLLQRSALPPTRILAFGLGEMAGRTDWRRLVLSLAGDQ